MKRGGIIAIAVLSIVSAGLLAILVWRAAADRADAAEWALKDETNRITIDNLAAEAKASADAAAASFAESQKQKEARAELAKKLAAMRASRDARPTPRTLEDCKVQLHAADGFVEELQVAILMDTATIAALSSALDHKSTQASQLGTALSMERERADGWREFSRKKEKRARIKMAFVGIGSGIGGGLVGYGIGATRN